MATPLRKSPSSLEGENVLRQQSPSATTATAAAPTITETYAYNSPYWAEFYDIWVSRLFSAESLEADNLFFYSLLSPFVSGRRSRDRDLNPEVSLDTTNANSSNRAVEDVIRVVDIGTGTGRVIRGILKQLQQSQLAPSAPAAITGSAGIEFWGIDHSAAMLDRARQVLATEFPSVKQEDSIPVMDPGSNTIHSSDVGDSSGGRRHRSQLDGITVKWNQSSAQDFVSKNPELCDSVDLLIFAAGSIGHLTEQSEREQFLEQVKSALRKTTTCYPAAGGGRGQEEAGRSAVAAISLLFGMGEQQETKAAPPRQTSAHAEEAGRDSGPLNTIAVELSSSMQADSSRWPHLAYRKSPTTTTRDPKEKTIVTDSFTLSTYDKKTGTVLNTTEHEWRLKEFHQQEWKDEIGRSGLVIREIRDKGMEAWYLLGLPIPYSLPAKE